MMKSIPLCLVPIALGLFVAGCASSDTPQASDQVKAQFKGGPMPPDARKKFEESMAKNRAATQPPQNGGKP